MNWLLGILLVFVALLVLRGAKRGFVKTIVSMGSMVLILVIVSWINPHMSDFLKESTPVYNAVHERCTKIVERYFEKSEVSEEDGEISRELQMLVLENIPLPASVSNTLLENNNSEVYSEWGVERFSEYLTASFSHWVTNGIGFVLAFVVAIALVKMILCAVDMLTELPVVGFCNAVAGMAVGLFQAVLWIWVFFVVVTIMCHSSIGEILLQQIENSEILRILYDKNILLDVILAVVWL